VGGWGDGGGGLRAEGWLRAGRARLGVGQGGVEGGEVALRRQALRPRVAQQQLLREGGGAGEGREGGAAESAATLPLL
jgi:hypothetical protein